MDKRISWFEWAVLIAVVIVIVIAALVLIGPQPANIFHNVNNSM